MMVDDYKKSVISIAATLTDSVQGSDVQLRSVYARNTQYAEDMYRRVELAAARYFASGKEMVEAWKLLAVKGVLLTSDRDIDNLGIIVDKIKLVTAGQMASVQIAQELRSVLDGHAAAGSQLALILRDRIGPEWEKQLKAAVASGQALDFLADKFKGVGFAVGDVTKTISSQLSTMGTEFSYFIRTGFREAYDDVVQVLEQINKKLKEYNDKRSKESGGNGGNWVSDLWRDTKRTFGPVFQVGNSFSEGLTYPARVASGLMYPFTNLYQSASEDLYTRRQHYLGRMMHPDYASYNQYTDASRAEGSPLGRTEPITGDKTAKLAAEADEFNRKIRKEFHASVDDQVAYLHERYWQTYQEIMDRAAVNPFVDKEGGLARAYNALQEGLAKVGQKETRSTLGDFKDWDALTSHVDQASSALDQMLDRLAEVDASAGGDTYEKGLAKLDREFDKSAAAIEKEEGRIASLREQYRIKGKGDFGNAELEEWQGYLDARFDALMEYYEKVDQLNRQKAYVQGLDLTSRHLSDMSSLTGQGTDSAKKYAIWAEMEKSVTSNQGDSDEAVLARARAMEKYEAAMARYEQDRYAATQENVRQYAELTHNTDLSLRSQIEILRIQHEQTDEMTKRLVLEEQIKRLEERRSSPWLAGAKNALEEYAQTATDSYQHAHDMVMTLTKSMEDGLVQLVTKGKVELNNLFDTIIQGIARVAIQESVTGPLGKAASGAIKSGGSSLFGWLGDLFSFNAHGGIYADAPGLGAYRNNFVSSPTFFAFAQGGVGLMGEAGTEAIIPVRKMPSGDLGVQAQGMSGTNVLVYVENNTGAQVTQSESTGPNGERIIDIMVGQAVDRQLRSGRHDKALRSLFGMRRTGSFN